MLPQKLFPTLSCLTLLTLSSNTLNAAVTLYKLAPNQSLTITNTLTHLASAYCSIAAVPKVTSTIQIKMLEGSGLFNGTSVKKGGTLFETVYNTQHIAMSANAGASALFTNTSNYAIQALCDLA